MWFTTFALISAGSLCPITHSRGVSGFEPMLATISPGSSRIAFLLSAVELRRENRDFELRHNSRYRYSKLNGQTPLESLKGSQTHLRLPPQDQAPRAPLPKPESGGYHLIRFIRSKGILDVFGEDFKVPPEAIYEYVRATIDVADQTLSIYLNNDRIDRIKYRMR